MPRLTRILIFLLMILLALTCTSGKPFQQEIPGGGLYFSETGYSVKGEFLAEYQKAERPLIVFGFPISPVMNHPLRVGILVQYFQKARMELDPSAPAGERVSFAPLGSYMLDNTRPSIDANIDVTSAACRYFQTTKHYVCYAFLQFYFAHNGAEFFGDPLSEVVIEDGLSVQYFERARMEWRADRPVGRRVVLTDLGALFITGNGGEEPPLPDQLKRLSIHVFAANPLIGANEPQTLFVIVQDQLSRPVPKATVKITVLMADGSSSTYRPGETDATGLATQSNIIVRGFAPNQLVSVTVEVVAPGDVRGTMTSWFRIWW